MRKSILFFMALLASSLAFSQNKVDSLIHELDKIIEQKEQFQKQKNERIQSFKRLLEKDKQRVNLSFRYGVYNKIYEEYKSYIYDSAFYYADKLLNTGYQLKDEPKINHAKVKLSFTLLSTGMFKEALDTLTSIKTPQTMPNAVRADYLSIFARTYYDMADYASDKHFVPIYNEKGDEYLDPAFTLVEKDSPEYLSLLGLKYMRGKEIDEAIATFTQLLNYKLSDHHIAVAASSLGYIYRLNNQEAKAMEMLAIASISDIRSSIKETVAMRELAELLYKNGDIKRAYKYVNLALEDAYFYNAKHRKIQISNILPIIEGKQLEMVERQRGLLLYYSGIVTLLILLIIVFAVIIRNQYKKLKQVKTSLAESHQNLQKINNNLQEVNKIKEEYIGHFFNSISDYIEKIEKFKTSISRKVTAKKLDDIYDIVNNINAHHERERLYSSFDSIFLKIFPGFIEKFNTLFKEEDHFTLGEKQPLTPELRIFALIRLGISENEKIAKILGYSVNTIYTYKTRIRNKSIVPNDEFEKKLMEIRGV